MAETPPLLTPSSADVSYRPLSGFAVAGFAVAMLYALIVIGTTAIALARGEPFFLASYMVVVPAAGAVLSLLGQRHIANSEGTRVGMGLARWGLFLSVFVGLGYFAYATFTGLALSKQAGDFLMVKNDDDSGFLPRLQEAARDPLELNAAFLLTLPGGDREGLTKEDERNLRIVQDQPAKEGGPGNLTRFRTDKLVRTLAQGGTENSDIESLGMQRWYFDGGAYHVHRRYRIRTPEINFTVLLPAQTSRDRKGERKWFVNYPAMQLEAETMTPFGKTMFRLRQNVHLWIKNELLPTLQQEPLKDFDKVDGTNWSAVIPGAELRPRVQQSVKELFSGDRPNRFAEMSVDVRPRFAPWRRVDGRLQMHQDFAMPLLLANGDRYVISGEFVVESRDKLDPQTPPSSPEWQLAQIRIASAGRLALPSP
jgi:hypothetical protein